MYHADDTERTGQAKDKGEYGMAPKYGRSIEVGQEDEGDHRDTGDAADVSAEKVVVTL